MQNAITSFKAIQIIKKSIKSAARRAQKPALQLSTTKFTVSGILNSEFFENFGGIPYQFRA